MTISIRFNLKRCHTIAQRKFVTTVKLAVSLKRVEPSHYSCLFIGTMLQEWEIKARSRYCVRTDEPFADGDPIYTLLFRDRGGFRREDVSEKAWQKAEKGAAPFSFWKSKYQAPEPPAPEQVPKESAEELLRKLITEDRPEHVNIRYVLAILLERKKTLKQVDVRESGQERILIYEHAKTGEVFIVGDPLLKLDQLDSVQEEVYALLMPKGAAVQPEQ
jgi:hypothetical protein